MFSFRSSETNTFTQTSEAWMVLIGCIPLISVWSLGASSLSTLGGTGICPKYWQCLMICPTDVHQYFPRSLFYRKQSGYHRGLQEYHGLYMNKNKRSGATFSFISTGCRILWVFHAFPPGEFSHWTLETFWFPIAFSLNSPSVKSMEQKHHVIWIVQGSIVYTLFPRNDYGPLTYQNFYSTTR